MINAGLTGGIASGKSTVADMFVARGAHLIDFDKLAHKAQEQGRPAWKEIIKHFGKGILRDDQSIDRNKLAQIVFAHPEQLSALNKIVHPRVFEDWHASLEEIKRKKKSAIVLSDVPLLFEAKLQDLFDLTILVLISPEEQIYRLMARNIISRGEAKIRLANQMPIEDKIKLADIVIDNKGSIAETEKKVAEVWKLLQQREKINHGYEPQGKP